MYRRYALAALALFALVATGAFASGSAESGSAKKTSFNVYYAFTPKSARGVVFRDFVKKYNNDHSGQVTVKLDYFADWIPLQQKIRTMVSAGSPPDVFYFNYNPNDRSLFQSGQLLDFNPYMDSKWRSRFFASDLKSLSYNGKLYAIPGEQGPVVFYYNMALLKKVGFNSPPVTWKQFFSLADKLKSKGIATASLFTANDAWYATNFLSYFASELGGPGVFKAGTSLDSSAVVKAAGTLQRLFKYASSDAVGEKWAQSVQDFVHGRTAVLADGPWVIGILNGQMSDPTQVVPANPPVFSKGAPTVLVTDAITPWAASGRLSAAQKPAVVGFLKSLTSEQVMKDFAIKGKDIWAVKLHLTPAQIKAAGPKLAANIRLASTAAQKVVQLTRVIKPSALNQIPSLVSGLAVGNVTPQKFASSLQKYNQQ